MGAPPAPTSTSDAELMRAAQRGDLAAFARLVRRWQAPMARFLGRLAGPGLDVSDLCQELFLKMHQARAAYVEQGAFSAWLYRLALNVARDALRRKKRRPAPLEAAAEPSLCVPDGLRLHRQEEAELVAAALAELPPPQREAIVLRHFEGLSFEAMARLLGVPATTLKSRFAVGLSRLKEALTARGLAPEDEEP